MRPPGDPDFGGDRPDLELLLETELVDFRRGLGVDLVDRYFDGDSSAVPVEITRIVIRFQELTTELAEIRAEWTAEGHEPTAEEREQMRAFVAELELVIAAMRETLE